MTFERMMAFLTDLFSHKCDRVDRDNHITARLVWRDANGAVTRVESAKISYASALKQTITVEMNSAEYVEEF